MANSVTVTLEGAPEFRAKLKKLGADVAGPIIEEAVDVGLDIMLSAVDRYTPVKTGFLKRHNQKQIWERKDGYVEGEVFNNAQHAHLVEFGHGGKRPAGPHPFMRPGFDASKAGAESAMSGVLKRKLEGY